MAHQFKPVDRESGMLLPHNMLDWVPEGHAVRVVIGTVEQLVTRDLTGRLVPPTDHGSAAGPARYDPVMLLTVWMYAYLRGVLATRAVEDRCRYDATFRVACGRQIPDHATFSRFRQHLFAREGLAEELFTRFCGCARARGWGGHAPRGRPAARLKPRHRTVTSIKTGMAPARETRGNRTGPA
jgi:transposase